jgi:hypothetical protein
VDGKSSDPFVIIQSGKSTVKTAVKKRNLNPVWEQVLHFVCEEELGVLVQVWDSNLLSKNIFMGSFKISTSELKFKEPNWYSLTESNESQVMITFYQGHLKEKEISVINKILKFEKEMGPTQEIVSLKKYKSTQPGDLSFQEKEKLTVSIPSMAKNWWEAINEKGESGKVPSNYFESKQEKPKEKKSKKDSKEVVGTETKKKEKKESDSTKPKKSKESEEEIKKNGKETEKVKKESKKKKEKKETEGETKPKKKKKEKDSQETEGEAKPKKKKEKKESKGESKQKKEKDSTKEKKETESKEKKGKKGNPNVKSLVGKVTGALKSIQGEEVEEKKDEAQKES